MTATENVGPGARGGSTLRNRISVAAAAGIPATLYLLYVFHYSIDVPYFDDWSVIRVVHLSLHRHLNVSELWRQYGDTRPFVARLFFVAFGRFDHLNEKSIMMFSAVILVAGFVLLLFLFRSYLGRRLTFLPVLSLGVVWFSLADVQSALWSFQLTWYLAVFFLVATAYLLLVPRDRRNAFFALGIAAAIAGSLSFLQGFLVWPLGLLCLLWVGPWSRRTFYEAAIWVSAAAITMATYLYGYNFDNPACTADGGQKSACSLTYGLHHPDRLARFFVLLVGNVVPTKIWSIEPRYFRAQEVLGLVICIVAGFVVVQSIRERRLQPNPLPLLLIVFAVLCDIMIASSHVGLGILAAGINRFTMPNLVLIVGIVVYAWGHVPNLGKARRPISGRGWLKALAIGTLIAFLVAQCVLTTKFGITNGRVTRANRVVAARVAVNLDRIPRHKRTCYRYRAFGFLELNLALAKQDRLSVFQPSSTERRYRAQGPPILARGNVCITTEALPAGQVGAPYSATLAATGGVPPYVWHAARLPTGLTLDASTGVISGSPRVRGSFKVFVRIVDHRKKIGIIQNTYSRALSLRIYQKS